MFLVLFAWLFKTRILNNNRASSGKLCYVIQTCWDKLKQCGVIITGQVQAGFATSYKRDGASVLNAKKVKQLSNRISFKRL